MGAHGGVDGCVHFLLARHVNPCNHVPVVVWHHLFNNITGEHLLAVDDAGNFEHFRGLSFQFNFQFSPFFAAGQVAQHGFVDGGGRLGDAVHHDSASQTATLEHHPCILWTAWTVLTGKAIVQR